MYRSINFYTAGGIGSRRGFAYGAVGPNAIYQDKYGQWYQST